MKLDINDYPLITAILEGGKKEKMYNSFISFLESAEQTLESGEILNPQFNDIKYDINRITDIIFKLAISDKYFYAGKFEQLPEEVQYLMVPYELRSVNAYVKKLDKVKECHQLEIYSDVKSLAKEFESITEIYNFMKEKVIKVTEKRKEEKEKNEEQDEQWHKHLVNHKDVKEVLNLLNEKSQFIHDSLMQSHLKQVLHIVDIFKKNVSEGISDYRKIFGKNIFALVTLQSITERKGTYYNPEYQLTEDYANKCEQMSKEYAQDIVNKFTYKNTHKLGYILTEKNNLKSVSLSNLKLDTGYIECDIECQFEDGSQFIANSSMVLSYSKYNKPFYRYPTIFRDVILPNGERITNPSEEKMEEIFVIKKNTLKIK